MIGDVLTTAKLSAIEAEIDQIDSEIDWRDPNLEASWFDWAESRLHHLIATIEQSERNLGKPRLTIVHGGAA